MAQRGTGVCRNLCSLLRHAESLIPSSLNDEDFLLLRVFCDQLQPLIRSEFEESEAEASSSFLVRKKRKRSIMNDEQMVMIEKALADEPDMQRNSASIQFWADKLSQNGSEVITSSQLKNWLNNRKAKLARANKQTGS